MTVRFGKDQPVEKNGMATDGVAMPEFLSRRDRATEAWTVEQGAPVRGEAHTNLTDRVMRVPFGNSPAARVIRAHEMIHAKVSPLAVPNSIIVDGVVVGSEAIRAAEEVRVNSLVKTAGFDIDLLTDGSERSTGKRIAEMGLTEGWNHAITFGSALIGTKALTAFTSGVTAGDKEMGELLKAALKDIKKTHTRLTKRYGRKATASTEIARDSDGAEMPAGFTNVSLPLAVAIQLSMVSSSEDSQPGDIESDIRRRVESSGRGSWALPIIRKDLLLTQHVNGRIGRKRIASQTGTNPRRLDRMLTDPERRVFDRRSRGKGGIVLIDQSGSMRLSNTEIDAMVAEAPGCVIIGYSHQPGSTAIPNIWVIANRGKVCEQIPGGNGGNGVDGPAIRFALTHRRTGEPFVWVCDGYVTDSKDELGEHLTNECAELVMKHRIHMVAEADEAISALRRARNSRLPVRAVGHISGSTPWQNRGEFLESESEESESPY